MAASPLQLDVGLTGAGLIASWSPTAALWPSEDLRFPQELPENGGLVPGSYRVTSQWRTKKQESSGEEEMRANRLQEFKWQNFFTNPTEWWDNRTAWVQSGMKRPARVSCAQQSLLSCPQEVHRAQGAASGQTNPCS